MTWKLDSRYVGYPAIEPFIPTLALSGLPTGTPWPPVTTGMIACAEDPVWGGGAEFVMAKANGTIPLRAICTITPVWNSTNRNYDWNAIVAPNTANLGKMIGVCMSEQGGVGAVNALTTGQFGWFMVTGLTPVNGTATVAAGTSVGLTGAGQIGAFAAGKQINNAQSVTPATQTVTGTGAGASGDTKISMTNVDGFFVGCYLSGTGVGASAICQAIDRVSNVLTASVANSAAIAGTVTGTYNNATIFYNVVQLNRSFAQGQIT
jgi:hypothetical protein